MEVWALSSEFWVLCELQSGHWLDGSSSLFLCCCPFSRNLSHQNLWSQGHTGNLGAQPDWEWLRSVIREHSGWGGILNPHFNICIFLGRKGLEMHVGFSTLHRYITRWKTEEKVLSAQNNENQRISLKLLPKWISHSFLSVNNGIQIFLLHKWELCVCVLISFQEKPQNKLEATQPGTESTILLDGVPHWTHWPQLSTDVRTHTTDPELGWDCFHYFSWQMGVITGIHATFAKCILHCFSLCHHTLSQSQYVVT